jgi:general stress protein 26
MPITSPVTRLDARFSSDGATATPWVDAVAVLETAEIFWLTTVRPDGRPHVTPLLSIWLDGALYFCTGADERKAKNLEGNPRCAITTGCISLSSGLDIVIEGVASRITGAATLERLGEMYASKYGPDWLLVAVDGALRGPDGNVAVVYGITPTVAFGFGKGEFSQTRWRF